MVIVKLYKCNSVHNCGDCVHATPHPKTDSCAFDMCIYRGRVCDTECKVVKVKGKRK